MSWGEKNGIPLLRVPLVQNFLTQVTFVPPCSARQRASFWLDFCVVWGEGGLVEILGFNWGDGWGKSERWIFMDVDKWYEGRRVGEKAEFFV